MAGAIWGSGRAKQPAQILSALLPALSDHGTVAARRTRGMARTDIPVGRGVQIR
jgi:hypothetical protein